MHPLHAGHDILTELPDRLSELGLDGGRAFVVGDSNVMPLYSGKLREALEAAGWSVSECVVPAGEGSKGLRTASLLWDWLVDERADRRSVLFALGGGVVGDLGGWVAATYLRGIRLVQLPTTLLAQVDAAIGGKTGINHPRAKNLIGSFYPPVLTFVDTAFLGSLPPRELTSGWAEVIKTALIADSDLFEYLMQQADALLTLEPEPLQHVVRRCGEIKLEVVTDDPRESGRRMTLNYGHTIGHALEAAAGYGRLSHGEAVAVGMRGAAKIGVDLGVLDPAGQALQAEAIQRFGLPASAPGVDEESVLSAMQLDKKAQSGSLRWVLLRDIGHTEIVSDVPAEVVRRAVAECVQ